MADNYLITGYWGEPHVTAENDRGIHAAIFGAGRFVLPVGEQFRAEYIGNNTVRMYDGKLLDNGAAAGIPAGEYVDLVISSAGQGMSRNDLIVFQYEQNASSLVETGSFVVVQGEETSETAADPALTQNDLLSGEATFDQMALWRVSVSGTTVSEPVQLFAVSASVATAKSAADAAQATASSAASAASAAQTTANDKAPTNHASTATTHGIGTGSNYGHVKLSDSVSSTSAASAGIAASPKAIKTVNDKIPAYTSGTATLNTTNAASGTVKYYKYGRVVQVYVNTVKMYISQINSATWTAFILASGLPAPVAAFNVHMTVENSQSEKGQLQIDTSGNLKFYHHDEDLVRGGTSGQCYVVGSFTYVSAS